MTDTATLTHADLAHHTARIVRDSGTSFYWAMRLLGRERRTAMYAVYAFCRAVDDIADGNADQQDKRAELDQWRHEIGHVYAGNANTMIGHALQDVVTRYTLDQGDFLAVIHGMETDAAGLVRLEDQDALESYMDDVACAVGRLSTPIFGISGAAGTALAKSLGEALQITNILRDLDEDAANDRLYLPVDALKAAGCDTTGDVRAVIADPACADVCNGLVAQAEVRFAEADRLLSTLDRQSARAPRMMSVAYQRLLAKIVQRGWNVPHSRVSLSLPEKLWIVMRYGWA